MRSPEVDIVIFEKKFRIKIDTGATINVIDEKGFDLLGIKPKLDKHDKQAYAYCSDKPLNSLGKFSTQISFKNKTINAEFIVIKGFSGNLLGYNSSIQLGIVEIINTVNAELNDPLLNLYAAKYPSVFSGRIGEYKNYELELHIDKTIRPVQAKPRYTPFHLRKAIEKQLNEKIKNGIIERVVDEPTEWLSETVYIPKPNTDEIRICTDMRAANKAILREKYEMPNIEEIIYEINGEKLFSKIDLNSAFEQIKLSPQSRYISRFRTHIGIFQYKRLFFGVSSAPEIFHNIIKNVISWISNAKNVSDDILIYGINEIDHDKALDSVLNRLERNGLTVNKNKCIFKKPEINFFGLKLSHNGVLLNQEKTIALKNAQVPRNASELHSFLGLIVYASRWIKDLATISEPLWRLTKKSVRWEWNELHESSFNQIKLTLLEKAIGGFDLNWKTIVTVDASPVGLGAVLTQADPNNSKNTKIIIFVSRKLSPTEQKYSQIEKEALALVWACERLQLYLLGNSFRLITDNKAVSLIFKNPLSKPPARKQRWSLRLYGFDFEVEHRPGLGNISDFLSRHPSQAENNIDDTEDYIHVLIENRIPKSLTRDEIIRATIRDPVLTKLINMIRKNKFIPSADLKPYSKVFNELTTTADGLILRDSRIIIPVELQEHIINIAHEGHLGLVKTKQLIRSKVWFSKHKFISWIKN